MFDFADQLLKYTRNSMVDCQYFITYRMFCFFFCLYIVTHLINQYRNENYMNILHTHSNIPLYIQILPTTNNKENKGKKTTVGYQTYGHIRFPLILICGIKGMDYKFLMQEKIQLFYQ